MPGDGLIRLRLDIAYDGRDFAGWAKQTDLRSVQEELERSLGHLLGADLTITCAGRTDAGVHARGQVAHTDLPADFDGTALDVRRLNRALPGDIRLLAIRRASMPASRPSGAATRTASATASSDRTPWSDTRPFDGRGNSTSTR